MPERVLIVDDDDAQRERLEHLLASEGYRVSAAHDAKTALERIDSTPVDLVVCDGRMRGLDGFELLPQITRALPGVPVVMTSASAASEISGEALELAAHDCLAKPVQPSDLRLILKRNTERQGLRRANLQLHREIVRATGERPIVAASGRMIELLELMERTASSGSNTLLRGEPGTGKEVLARAIHSQSLRRDQPFVAVDCSGASRDGFEGEIFGHGGGIFPGAERPRRGYFADAERGTLFLDEIGDLPMPLQAKLLRVLQDKEVLPIGEIKPFKTNVRVIAASARDLPHEVAEGRFREDLYYRLCVIQLEVPALRDRREDIPLLCDHFLARLGEELGKDVRSITDEALERLTAHAWPGNLRELENVIERAVLLANGARITLRELPDAVTNASLDDSDPSRGFSLKRARRLFEADWIRRALRATSGNRTHAAKRLEISHRALLYKIKEYGIPD